MENWNGNEISVLLSETEFERSGLGFLYSFMDSYLGPTAKLSLGKASLQPKRTLVSLGLLAADVTW